MTPLDKIKGRAERSVLLLFLLQIEKVDIMKSFLCLFNNYNKIIFHFFIYIIVRLQNIWKKSIIFRIMIK